MNQPTVSDTYMPSALGTFDGGEEVQKLDLETFRERRTDAELENAPKYWRRLLAGLRYLGNSAYPALKANTKWGDWTLKDVLSYFGKIVDTLRRDCRFLLTPPKPGDESYGTSFWETYREADKRGFITVPPPKDEAEEKKWQEQRAKILKADDKDIKVSELFAALPDEIVALPKCVSLTGSYLYGKGKPNDVDFVLRQSLPGGALLKLDRTLQRILGTDESIQFILEEQGAVWDNLPLYDLVLRKRLKPEIEHVDSEAFQEEFYKSLRVFFNMPGGKAGWTKALLAAVPPHELYVEPFIGAGALFLAKEPVAQEVINDNNPEIAFLWRFLRDMSDKDITQLRRMRWNGNKDFYETLKNQNPSTLSPRERFRREICLHCLSAMGLQRNVNLARLESGTQPFQATFLKSLERYRERLKGVKIYNQDWAKIVDKYDSPSTFIYLDPPYANTGTSDVAGFGSITAEEIVPFLKRARGKVLLSYADKPVARRVFKDFRIHYIKGPGHAVGGLFEGIKPGMRTELLVANYTLRIPRELQKAVLVTTPGAIRPGVPIKHYGVAGEYYLPHEVDQAWEKWGRRLVDKGEKIVIQPKFDGFRLTVSNSNGTLKVFTEKGTDQSKVFPGLAELLDKAGLKDVVLDTEFVQYKTKAFRAPESRTQMAWMGSAKEPNEVPVTVFVHDLMWHNGKNIADKPYLERLRPIKGLRATEGRWRIMIAPTKVVNTRAGFKAAVEWANRQRQLSSEGAMAKLASFKYDPVKAKTDIIKLKRQIEIDARVIGYRKIFAGKPEGTTWTRSQALSKVKELREASKTYQLRVALKDEDTGHLIPIEASKRLGKKDVKLDYDEKEQTWTGTEDPKLWVMFPPFKNRRIGELAYGNIYNIALEAPPQNGQIATVAPMEVTIFTQDGKAHVSFQHPICKQLKPKGSPVGTIQSALIAHNKKPGGYGPWVSISKAWNWIKIVRRLN